jgi:hypothetical protein
MFSKVGLGPYLNPNLRGRLIREKGSSLLTGWAWPLPKPYFEGEIHEGIGILCSQRLGLALT